VAVERPSYITMTKCRDVRRWHSSAPRVVSRAAAAAGLLAIGSQLRSSVPSEDFTLPFEGSEQRIRVASSRLSRSSALPLNSRPASSKAAISGTTVIPAAGLTASGLLLSFGLAARRRQKKASVAKKALSPEGIEFVNQLQQFWQHVFAGNHGVSGAEDLAAAWQHWADTADSLVAGTSQAVKDFWPPAYAADPVVLDPNVKYLYGVDGAVLLDPMNNKPLTDDWWNGFIGLQAGFIKDIDAKLRDLGVEQAFGWTIVAYTLLVKVLFYPLQQSQLRSTSMMQLLQPKMKEIQERYKDDPETMNRLLGQLYSVMDVNPLGGCLPVLLQLPIFWSLYGVWRRLAAERFPHYSEGWLWVPSLAEPNPDFQFKFDWLLQFENGAPKMGWHDYLCYLIFPVLLVGFTIVSQQQAQTARPKTDDDSSQSLILQVLPWISVYFIGSLSLELPQAVSVYYSMNTVLSLAQTQLVKWGLRQEIPGYAEFEKTGKFPDGAFEDMVRASSPAPKTLHEAALQGNAQAVESFLNGISPEKDAGKIEVPDINAWDDKQIAPIGYAVACGHLETVRLLLQRGADVQIRDGQDNTLLHYAAGYGHQQVLEELLKASQQKWPKDEWKEIRNRKGQSVLDAARVNRKGTVVDFLCDRLGLDAEVVKLPPATVPEAVPATGEQNEAAARARAAMLAAAGAQEGAANGAALDPKQAQAAAAFQAAIEKLKSNPQAVEQARQMMGKVPPQMLSMLTGNKMSPEEAQKAMDAMSKMSTEDIIAKADLAAEKLKEVQGVAPPSSGKPARSVD
jgi:YidC/Oxa1 family membrane protein insertase